MSVYFAESGPYMKIGFSANPFQRRESVTRLGRRPADLPQGSDVDLIGWIPGDRKAEARMHERFAHIRVAGEWFWSEREAVLALIWSDPRGVDMHGMSALAVMAMLEYPTLTRDDVEGAGVQVKAIPLEAALERVSRAFTFGIRGAA